MAAGNLSRRDFVSSMGVVGAAGAIAAAAGGMTVAASPARAAAVADPSVITWDHECDVIICGGGGGLLAACDAADAGNEVIIIEKAPVLGGESCMNEGWMNASGTTLQAAEGIEDSPETQAADYAINQAANMDNIDQELLNDYCANSGASYERLVELGCEYILAQDTIFYSTVPRAHIIQPDASAWASVLGAAAEQRGVQIMLETPLTDIVTDAAGQVLGVKSGDIAIKARRGVVLATGDVSGNDVIKSRFQRAYGSIPAWDPFNTGDGLYAALAAGADTSFAQLTSVGPSLSYEPTGTVMDTFQVFKGAIIVNETGARFANEDDYAGTAFALASQPDTAGWLVFDSRVAAISMRPDCPTSEIYGRVTAGECVEIGLISGVGPAYLDDYLANGIATEAASLEELAQACGIDAAGLTAQVETWNASVTAGVDEAFGRMMTDAMQFGEMVGIEEGPFYALKMSSPRWVCAEGPNLMVNTDMSVLNPDGEPIERLYACGAGLVAGTCTLYANACGDHMGITAWSARRAAERVGALEPWEA